MNIERLTKLAALLDTIPTRKPKTGPHFDLVTWYCRTTACAVGHAALNEWFMARGLTVEPSHTSQGYTLVYSTGAKNYVNWDAVARFFDITHVTAEYLFAPCEYTKRRPGHRQIIAAQVAERVREEITAHMQGASTTFHTTVTQ